MGFIKGSSGLFSSGNTTVLNFLNEPMGMCIYVNIQNGNLDPENITTVLNDIISMLAFKFRT